MTIPEALETLDAALKKANLAKKPVKLKFVIPTFGGHGSLTQVEAIALMRENVKISAKNTGDILHPELAQWVNRVVKNNARAK
jgi:hypothetical protein